MSNFTKLMQQAAAGNAGGGFYPYTIENSARLDGSSYLYRTAGTATDARKGAISFWAKRGSLSASQVPFTSSGSSGGGYLELRSDDAFTFQDNGNSALLMTISRRLFRDTSAWYHFLLILDSTNPVANDRDKLYINGVRETDFAAGRQGNTTLNGTYQVLSASSADGMRIGSPPIPYNGYLAEVALVDGTVYSETDFGEFKNGVWTPKDISGLTFGNNGFYLDFSNSAALGTDVSGNGNNFTSSGLTSSDQMIDTPTNNFMNAGVLVPRITGGVTYKPSNSEGNLQLVTSNSNSALGQGFPKSGKWYFEFQCRNSYPDGGYRCYIGVATNTPSSTTTSTGADSDDMLVYRYYDYGDSSRYRSNSLGGWQQTDSAGSNSLTNGTIVSMAVDMDNGSVTAYVDGTLAKSITWASSAFSRKDVRLVLGGDGSPSYSNTLIDFNFGQNGDFNGQKTAQGNADENGIGDFYYTPPSGYLACCSQNMPEPTIGPNSATTSDENFDTALYTGNGGTTTVSSLNFQPDFTWLKSRTYARYHALADVLRGSTKFLSSNSTSAEDTVDSGNGVVWNSTGFEVDASSDWNSLNESGANIVAWNWKANGSGVTNTDGSITSTVSANQDAGFSIVTYTGTGANATVGHGLSSAPKVVLIKSRTAATNWYMQHGSAGIGYLRLSGTDAYNSDGGMFNNIFPTTSVFGVGVNGYSVNDTSAGYVAYCFAEVEGFSSFGKFTGNGSADGPFVFTGFRPAWVMFKRTDSAVGGDWLILDTTREPYNVAGVKRLYANTTSVESPNSYFDFLSNGFKARQAGASGINESGGTYIYMAFAENPFKYSNAR